MKGWFDSNYWMVLTPNGKTEANGILFTAYCLYLKGDLQNFIEALGYFAIKPNHVSHDNITGYFAILKFAGRHVSFPNEKWREDYLHPRDMAFYFLLRNQKFLGIPKAFLKWSMKKSCQKKYKYRHPDRSLKPKDDWDFWFRMKIYYKERFKRDECNEYLHTDGKLLSWLRCQALGWDDYWQELETHMPWFNRHGENVLNGIFNTYFTHPQNPLRWLSR